MVFGHSRRKRSSCYVTISQYAAADAGRNCNLVVFYIYYGCWYNIY